MHFCPEGVGCSVSSFDCAQLDSGVERHASDSIKTGGALVEAMSFYEDLRLDLSISHTMNCINCKSKPNLRRDGKMCVLCQKQY